MAITPEKIEKYFKLKLAAEISPRGLKSLQEKGEKIQIVDVRSADEYKAGFVPGAVNIPYAELEKQYKTLNKKVRTILYCSDFACQASSKAALFLSKKGYYATIVIGGFETYKAKGLPVAAKKSKFEKAKEIVETANAVEMIASTALSA